MMFRPGDIVRRRNDESRTFTIKETFYSERYECNHVILEGHSDSWFEGRFELVCRPKGSFSLDILDD